MNATVAIVGRPNVGKSTLFNRLTGQRKAIVDDISGVTRDRLYGIAEWGGIEFNLIDTGGFVPNSDDVFEVAIREQVDIAIEESHLLLFMLDVTTGITDLDQMMADKLRKAKQDVIVVVNKVDNHQRSLDAAEFYSLGFSDMIMVSSMSGSGTGELLDLAVEKIDALQLGKADEETAGLPKFAIIGQPNVGKSSFVNTLIGEQRNIVTPIAGTTRDTIHTRYNYYNKDFLLIDTAGIRKKSKVHENLEFYSVIRAVKAVDEADVCMLLLDAQVGIEAQDLKILQIVERKKKGLIILVNKWDLVAKDNSTLEAYKKRILERTAPFTDIPILFISVLEKQRIYQSIEAAIDVYRNRQKKIPTSKLNEVLLPAIERYPPPAVKGKYIKIKYITQLPTHTPSFAFFANLPQYIKAPYRNYLENQIRKAFDFQGVPLNIFFRKK